MSLDREDGRGDCAPLAGRDSVAEELGDRRLRRVCVCVFVLPSIPRLPRCTPSGVMRDLRLCGASWAAGGTWSIAPKPGKKLSSQSSIPPGVLKFGASSGSPRGFGSQVTSRVLGALLDATRGRVRRSGEARRTRTFDVVDGTGDDSLDDSSFVLLPLSARVVNIQSS